MKKKPLTYETEAALCADFIAWVKRIEKPKWTAYAETAGWDILLVAEDGTQIGVQAKLRFNMKVLHQTIPEGNYDAWRDTGPDFRSILLPSRDGTAEDICGALGIVIFSPGYCGRENKPGFNPDFTQENRYGDDWHYWNPRTRHELPEFVPDVVAGDSGPVQLTKWKINALRIVATLEGRGYVTRKDFKRYGIDPRRWLSHTQWLVASADYVGEYTRGPALDFDKQHTGVYPQVLAEVRDVIAAEAAQLRLKRPVQESLV